MEYHPFVWLLYILCIALFSRIIIYSIRKNKEKKERELLETVTSLERGNWSERALILKLLKQGIPAITIFHDLYVEKINSNYSQIDAVIATKAGIIVFEVKDYSGWIFGKGSQTYWTQILAYGEEKYRLYNPVKQNQKHIEALKNKMKQCGDIPFYSLIVFYGDCTLKEINYIPKDTYIIYPSQVSNTINFILENNHPANFTNKREVVNILKEGVNNGNNPEILTKHIQYINHILSKQK